METRYFILFRNKDYADTIALELNGIIRNSDIEILGITPQKNDVFMIDAHFDGLMSRLNGVDTVKKLLRNQHKCCFKIQVFSWLSLKQISYLYPEKSAVLTSANIQFCRFPFILSKKTET